MPIRLGMRYGNSTFRSRQGWLGVLACLALLPSVSGWAKSYIVQWRDTLSAISQKHSGSPIYGRTGTLVRLLALNTGVRNPDKIFPGQKIELEEPALSGAWAKDSNRAPAGELDHPAAEAKISNDSSTERKRANAIGRFFVEADYRSTQISAHDRGSAASATLFSRSNFGVSLGVAQQWSPRFSTNIYFNFRRLDLEPPANNPSALLNAMQKLHAFGVGVRSELGDAAALTAGVGSRQDLFLAGVSQNQSQPVPRHRYYADLGFERTMVRVKDLALQLSARGTLYAPQSGADFTTRTGLGALASFGVHQQITKRLSYQASLFYEHFNENTNLVNQIQSDVGIALRLTLPLGEEAKPTP